MSSSTIPAKYILFSHYGYHEEDDFKARKNGTAIKNLPGVRHLCGHFRGLKELLTTPGHEGILVLFYAPGYEGFLEGLYNQRSDGQLLAEEQCPSESNALYNERMRLRFAKEVAECVLGKLKKIKLENRVRFLTSFDLRVILGRANAILTARFHRFFIGQARGLRYDAPKVVEAILRLRILGNGVPVLRLDHDVIFREKNQDMDDLGLFKAVACAVRAYQLRLAQPTISTFLFSASYNSRALRYPTAGIDRFEAWSGAFATRIYPALIANPEKVSEICNLPSETAEQKKEKDCEWQKYVGEHLDETLARRFYGLKENVTGLKAQGTAGLISIGAHPLNSVISGALLCLSEGAILDLPPFSNLGVNVMWIDDHLKYSLHRAMNHFTADEILDSEPGLSNARLNDVTVTKGRPSVGNLPSYVFEVYLPTLLWGSIMDAWITINPILKCCFATLNQEEKNIWQLAKSSQHQAPLPEAMLEALRVGSFDANSRERLREKLEKSALERIEQVRQLWAELKTEDHRTFASYWAEGEVESVFSKQCFNICPDRLWQGIVINRQIDNPIKQLDDLSAALALKVSNLINDTLAYVEWTLEWPKFVQIVRSVRKGDFIGDLNWQP